LHYIIIILFKIVPNPEGFCLFFRFKYIWIPPLTHI